MNLSRRSFLGGALALMAAPVVAKYIPILPRLVGDGHHDDTAGLNALFAGEPVDIVRDVARVFDESPFGSVRLIGGIFRITGPVSIVNRSDFEIAESVFIGQGGGDAMFRLVNCERAVLRSLRLHCDGYDTAVYVDGACRNTCFDRNIFHRNDFRRFHFSTQEKAA